MHGSYRRIIIAAVGWLILAAANHPAERSGSKAGANQASPAPRTTATPSPSPAPSPSAPFAAYSPYDAEGCYRAKDSNAANLCAYWRAAVAAEKSAKEAHRATNWAIVATVLSGCAFLAILWSLRQTHGALGEARRGNRLNLLFEKRARREARESARATSIIIEETRRQADAAVAAQRAWVTIAMHPKMARRSGIDGLYFMVDFVTENIGDTIATHFNIEHEAFFKGQGESIDEFNQRVAQWISEIRDDYGAPESSCLIPKDTTTSHFWFSRKKNEINWWEGTIFGWPVAQPIFLCAVFYRTIHHPETVQMSWRSWYLSEVGDDGQATTFIRRQTEELGSERLTVDPLRLSMMHEPYAAPPGDA